MTEHYFTENPEVEHDISLIDYTFNEHNLQFKTDAGVFSKDRVDFGSNVLVTTIKLPATGKLLDIGCGYGPIGISVAKANPSLEVTMIDINSRAVDLAQQNAKINEVANTRVLQSDGFDNIHETFDVIVMNPPIRAGKKVIYPIFEDSINYLNPSGIFYVVIRKKQGGPSALKKLKDVYGNCEKVNRSGGYWVLRCEKGSS